MTCKFLDYVKTAWLEATDTANANPRDADSEWIEIRMTTDGYLIIPKLVMDKELKKGEWERLLRAFLTQHYCKWIFRLNVNWESEWCPADLASGKKSKQVPYSAMKTNTEAFILNEYQPPGIILQDPRNMHLDDIQKVLQHCYNCQAESGPESAFRFGKIVAKRNHVFVNYPGSSNDQENKSDKIPANGRKKKKGKGKQQEDQEQGNELEQNPYNCAKKKGKGRRWEEQLQGLLKITQSEETATPDENGTEDHESQQAPKPNEPGHLPQEPLISPSRSEDPLVNIDPALHAQDVDQTAQQPDESSHTGNKAPAPPEADPTMQNPPTYIQHSSNDHPATKPNHDAELALNPIRNTRLGTNPEANLSPQPLRQPQTTNKRKKLTADDRAALEAQEMVQSGTRCRSKPTRGKW